MRRLATFLSLLAVLALIGAGCGGDDEPAAPAPPPPPPRLSVVATNSIVGDFVNVLTGGIADVTVLVAGGDPHGFQPSAQDLTDLANADLIIRSGAGLEPWLEPSLDDSASAGTVVDASAGVELRRELFNGVSQIDPHIWMSPVNTRTMVANVANALATASPQYETVIRSSERAYYSQLDSLSNSIRNSVAGLTNKKLVTGHRSMGYFAAEFGFDYVGSAIPSYDSSVKADDAYKQQLLANIAAQKVTAVFAENGNPSSYQLTEIADEARIKIASETSGLYVDSLGPRGGNADSYLKMMRQNTSNLVNGLG